MINLLPPEDKKRLRAARRNTIWVRYNLFLVAALIALNIVIGAVAFMIQIDKAAIQTKIDQNKSTNTSASSEQIKKQIEALKADMKIAKTLVDNQPDYVYGVINFYGSVPKNCFFPSVGSEQLAYGKEYTATFNCKYPEEDPTIDTQAELASYVSTELKKGLSFKNPVITSIKEDATENQKYPFSLSFKSTSLNPLDSTKNFTPKDCVPKIVFTLESPKVFAFDCRPVVKETPKPFEEPVYESKSTFEERIQKEFESKADTSNYKLDDIETTYQDLPTKEYSTGDDFSAFIVVKLQDKET